MRGRGGRGLSFKGKTSKPVAPAGLYAEDARNIERGEGEMSGAELSTLREGGEASSRLGRKAEPSLRTPKRVRASLRRRLRDQARDAACWRLKATHSS